MARPKVVTVRLARQPHHDAVLRVRAAYRRLRRLAAQPPMSDPLDSPSVAAASFTAAGGGRMAEVAALYARVSTTQQEQEATIESQVAALESYAQQQGYTLAPAYYFLDNGVSGAQLVRPALERLRDQAAAGAFAVVLCLSPDRLARQCAHQWVLLDELQRAGVKVIFSNQAPVSDEPQGQLLLGIQGLFAEYERAMITERCRRGRLYRIRCGALVSPNAPYGYRYIPVAGTRRWPLGTRTAGS